MKKKIRILDKLSIWKFVKNPFKKNITITALNTNGIHEPNGAKTVKGHINNAMKIKIL